MKSLASSTLFLVFSTIAPSFKRPAVTGRVLTMDSWNTAIMWGSSMGLFTRISVFGSAILTKAFTGVPFFSDPYDAKEDALSPIPNTTASASIFPPTFAPSPPIDSILTSKNPSSFFSGRVRFFLAEDFPFTAMVITPFEF